jgi:predicted dehydrogenase
VISHLRGFVEDTAFTGEDLVNLENRKYIMAVSSMLPMATALRALSYRRAQAGFWNLNNVKSSASQILHFHDQNPSVCSFWSRKMSSTHPSLEVVSTKSAFLAYDLDSNSLTASTTTGFRSTSSHWTVQPSNQSEWTALRLGYSRYGSDNDDHCRGRD